MKRALLVGIDTYPHVNGLDGCVNDARLMRTVLVETFGFDDAHITLLANEQATRAGILAAFDALIAAAQPDDVIVVHYAGHGSQMTDREGDEPSGFDSTLMPWDTGRDPHENRDITDDEIHLKLEALAARTSFTTLVVDACHSGTITRDAFGAKRRSAPPDRRPASALPPSPIPGARLTRTRSGASGWMPLATSYVLISGCRDDEESKEYEPPAGGTHGALTWFLSQALRTASSGTTYRDVFETVSAQVTAYNAVQHPQLEGPADRAIFGVTEITPQAFVAVTARTGQRVTLSHGAAMGVTVGSTYAVHAAGTKTPSGASLGTLTITAVQPFAAEAQVTQEANADAIVAGTRAFETSHAYGAQAMAVQLDAPEGPERTAMTAALAASTRVALARDSDAVAARICLLAPRTQLSESTPVPQAGALDAPAWAVVGAAGDLLMRLKAPGDVATVVANLERVAQAQRVLATTNPNPQSALRGAVTFEVLRQGPGGTWLPAVPDPDGGHLVFAAGDEVRFQVTSRHPKPVHVAFVDIGLSSAIAVAAQARLEPNTPFWIGGPLSVPAGYPFVDGADPVRGAGGIETMLVFVTEGPVDFKALEQTSVRGTSSPSPSPSPLSVLLAGAAGKSGPRTRDFTPTSVSTSDDWTVVSRSFAVRPRSAPLSANGAPAATAQAVVTSTALTGTVHAGTSPDGRDRVTGLATPALQAALDDAHVQMKQTVAIEGARAGSPGTRGAAPAVELSLKPPPEGFGQMVLATDELGVVSWCFADPPARTRGVSGGVPGRVYRIPSPVPDDDPGQPASRGLIGLAGAKIFKELIFPLVDPIAGEIGAALAQRMEDRRWPYRVRAMTPADYTRDDVPPLDRDGWARLGRGRALLLVHGTFSRSHLAFASLPPADMAALHQHYEGRVFAFDHHTLSADPKADRKSVV